MADAGSAADWFSGAMSGAAVIVALCLSRKADRDAARAQLNAHRAAAHRTLAKLIDVVNSVHTIHRHIEAQTKAAESAVSSSPDALPAASRLWRRVQPLVGFGDEENITFGTEESSPLIEAGQIDLLTDMMLLGRRHGALIATMKEYAIRRDALTELAPPPVDFDGMLGAVYLTAEQLIRL